MRLALLHRRLAVLMGIAALVTFAAGAGFEPLSSALSLTALLVALKWHPSRELSARLEPIWLPLAGLLVARAMWHLLVVGDDALVPVVDLLLLILCAESLRSLDAPNDARLYTLSFALILASSAYRPGIVFALAFVAYVLLATVALTLGHLRRKSLRFGVPDPPIDRPVVLATAGLGTVVLMASALVFVAFPRVSRGWAGMANMPGAAVAGFSDVVSIGEFGARIESNPTIVLRVEFPDGPPTDVGTLYWRGRSFDRFDGRRWTHSYQMPPSRAPASWYRERWPGPTMRQRIFATALDSRVMFALHPVLRVDTETRAQPVFDNAGDLLYFTVAAPAYTAWSIAGTPHPDSLRAAPEEGGFAPRGNRYLQLPRMPGRIAALADSLTRDAATRYDKAKAIEAWLRTFTYTLELPATAREATLDHFLFERRAGHCEYFSTAMVVMMRTLGFQAREVNGFRGGEWSEFGDYLAVTQNQAHSWVEVWFPEFGWVPFDPTPGGNGGSSTAASVFWPGRFLFDAIEHRWNKWVLDYNVDTQGGLLDRFRGLDEPADPADPAGERTGGGGPGPGLGWGVAAAALALVGAAAAFRRAGTRRPSETRAYLGLLESCRRAEIVGRGAIAPLALVEELERRGHTAAEPARRVVELYLRARFGAEPLDERERAQMTEALGAARARLRPA